MAGCSLCYGETDTYYFPVEGFVTSGYLKGKLEELFAAGTETATLDLKEQLPYIEVSDRTKMYDLAIGAYLLNP